MEQGDAFSVYIIDWLIPDMNGIEIVRQIRKVIGDSCPIIILTAYDWADIEEEARAAGVTAFCEKPLFLSELRKVLAEPSGCSRSRRLHRSPRQALTVSTCCWWRITPEPGDRHRDLKGSGLPCGYRRRRR